MCSTADILARCNYDGEVRTVHISSHGCGGWESLSEWLANHLKSRHISDMHRTIPPELGLFIFSLFMVPFISGLPRGRDSGCPSVFINFSHHSLTSSHPNVDRIEGRDHVLTGFSRLFLMNACQTTTLGYSFFLSLHSRTSAVGV